MICARLSRCRPSYCLTRSAYGLRWNTVDTKSSQVIYEGPFAQLAFRLKAVSITTALVGVVGIPFLIMIHSGDVPVAGQLAVGGSAILGAVGSTVAMDFVFSPYISTLERVPVRQCHSNKEESSEEQRAAQEWLLKATTRNILSMKVETVFDPTTDVTPYSGIRPFCNFLAKGRPMFVHPDLILDDTIRAQLVGDDEEQKPKQTKEDDDGFV